MYTPGLRALHNVKPNKVDSVAQQRKCKTSMKKGNSLPLVGPGYYGFIKPAPHSVKKQAKGFTIFKLFKRYFFKFILKQEGESRGAGAGASLPIPGNELHHDQRMR